MTTTRPHNLGSVATVAGNHPDDSGSVFRRRRQRGDENVLQLACVPDRPILGKSWAFALEPLSPTGDLTIRMTTYVIAVDELLEGNP